MKYEIGSTAVTSSNLYVLPANSAAPTRLQSLERRFFCRKTSGIMLCSYDTAAVAISSFGFSENTFTKPRRAEQHFADTCNFDNVYTNGNDH